MHEYNECTKHEYLGMHSVEGFTPYRQLGSYSRQKQVLAYSVLVENKFGLFCLFVAAGLNAPFIVLPHWDNMS